MYTSNSAKVFTVPRCHLHSHHQVAISVNPSLKLVVWSLAKTPVCWQRFSGSLLRAPLSGKDPIIGKTSSCNEYSMCFTRPLSTIFKKNRHWIVKSLLPNYSTTATLTLWPSSSDCDTTMNSALKSSQPSKTCHHLTSLTHSHSIQMHLFIFLSPVKQLRSHTFPLLHIFQSPTFSFWNVFSCSRIFIKTCNNTHCSFSVLHCLADLKEEYSGWHMKEKLVSGKRTSSASSTPLLPAHNHPNTSLSWCYLSPSPLCNP